MATADLTVARLRELLEYNPETGEFTRRVSLISNYPVGSVAGSITKTGYIGITVDGCRHLAHRLAVLYMTDKWPEQEVDHRDGVRANNRWENLREATVAENATNRRRSRSNSQSGYLGVRATQRGGRWRAAIAVDGKEKHLGTFDTPEQAHAAYLEAKRQIHSFCTI